MSKKPKIDITQPKEEFEEYLSDNDRLIFSGIYGIGKTTFLQKYFSQNEEYFDIHLFPANYSVAPNKDVFELIKYDIIRQLLSSKHISIEKVEIPEHLIASQFLVENAGDVTELFLKPFQVFGINASETFSKIKKLSQGYEKFSEEVQKSDYEWLEKFLESQHSETGNIYENDFYTELINEILNQEVNKDKVLIIDDFDRIDPAHIFRLLNVFSAHIDMDEDSNKFAFNKIILVCDIENIRNAFYYRYGENVDFDGYIDKFYENKIYHFDNYQGISSIIGEFLDNLTVRKSKYHPHYKNLETILSEIIDWLLRSGQINVRNILKLRRSSFGFKHEALNFPLTKGVNSKKIFLFPLYQFLSEIVGDSDALIRALESVKSYSDKRGLNTKRNNATNTFMMEWILPILSFNYHKFAGEGEGFKYDSVDGITFKFDIVEITVKGFPKSYFFRAKNFKALDGARETQNFDWFTYFIEAGKLLRDYGAI